MTTPKFSVRLELNTSYWPPEGKAWGSDRFYATLAGTRAGAITTEEAIGRAFVAAGLVEITYKCQDCDEPFEWPGQDHGWRCEECAKKRRERGLPRFDVAEISQPADRQPKERARKITGQAILAPPPPPPPPPPGSVPGRLRARTCEPDSGVACGWFSCARRVEPTLRSPPPRAPRRRRSRPISARPE